MGRAFSSSLRLQPSLKREVCAPEEAEVTHACVSSVAC